MDLLLLTVDPHPESVLPSLSLLAHNVRTAPTEVSSLLVAGTADVAIVDARTDLAAARGLCRLLGTTGTSVPVVAVVNEGGLVAVNVEWGLDEILLPGTGPAEIDARLRMIKGGGAALTREKIVAAVAKNFICIADGSKLVEQLGAFPLPVEVIPFGWPTTQALIEEMLVSMDVMGRNSTLRMTGDAPYVTDEGNHILDLHLGRIGDPRQLSLVLNQIPGVVENGLFVDICDTVIVGFGDGRIELRDINTGETENERLDFVENENMFADLGDWKRD